ncbi:Transmembrane channel-like protein 5 [Chamberlinius hualienensis]
MARSSQCTGWEYQSGSNYENFVSKPDVRRLTVKVNVSTDSAEEELLDSSSPLDDQIQCNQLDGSSTNDCLSPLSNRSSSLRNSQIVLRELPSRQINFSQTDLTDGYNDKCHYKRQKQWTMKSQARKAMMTRRRDDVNENEIIGSMMSNPNMNQAGTEADHIRMETIRDLNCSLTMKRKMKKQIGHVMTNKRKPTVVKSPTLTFKLTRVCYAVKSRVRQMCQKVDMWRTQMIQIEGKYGSSTTYYFRFLQFLICLNLVSFICTTSFVITPQLLLRFFYPGPINETLLSEDLLEAKNYSQNTLDKISDFLQKTYTLLQEEEYYYNRSIKFHWSDLITGSGYLSTTELYYGIYVNHSVTITGHEQYNLPLAYVLVIIITLIFSLLLLANRVAKAYRHHIVMNSGFGVQIYCNLVFCSWDFKVRNKRAAKIKVFGIRQEFELKIVQLKEETNPMNSKQKVTKCARHLLIHLIVLVILMVTAAFIWLLLQNNILKTGMPILDDMMVPLVITGLLIVVPFAFTLLLRWEKYINEITATCVNMIRMMMLLVTVIGVLCYFWFRTNAHEEASIPQNYCWETRLGEEIYKLLAVDFIIVNALTFIVTFIRRYLLNRCLGFPEFNLAWNTWNLIYTQMLGWLGALYIPPISVLVILKLTLTYYIKQVHIRLNCVPPARPWSASLTKTVFLSLAFMGLLFMLAPFCYSIYIMKPSPACGPYRDNENIVSVLLSSFQHFSMVDKVFGFIWTIFSMPGFVAVLLVILCATAFQAKSYAKSTKQLRERLKRQVMLEGNDKVFLLNMLDGATKALESIQTKRNSTISGNRQIFRFPSSNQNSIDIKSDNISKYGKGIIIISVQIGETKFHYIQVISEVRLNFLDLNLMSFSVIINFRIQRSYKSNI